MRDTAIQIFDFNNFQVRHLNKLYPLKILCLGQVCFQMKELIDLIRKGFIIKELRKKIAIEINL